jgi:hypothetical protein
MMNWVGNEDGSFHCEIDGERYTVFLKTVVNGRPWWRCRVGTDDGHESGGAETAEAVMRDAEDLAGHVREREALGRVTVTTPSRGPTEPRRRTPWGDSQEMTTYAPGIERHSTAGHGGFWVAQECRGEMPTALRAVGGWYEEDSDWCRVALSFPGLFTRRELRFAETTLINNYPEAYEAWTGRILEPGESYRKDECRWDEGHADALVVTSATTYEPDRSLLAVIAAIGGYRGGKRAGPGRHFLVPADEYAARGRFGFVIDLDRHQETSDHLVYFIVREDLAKVLREHEASRGGVLSNDPGDGTKLAPAFIAAYAQSRESGAPRYLFAEPHLDRPFVVSEEAPRAGNRYFRFEGGRVLERQADVGLKITSIVLRGPVEISDVQPVVKGSLKPTQAEAREILSKVGMTMRVRDGEFRVNFQGGTEATACYTDDLHDAIGSGQAMAREAAEQGVSLHASMPARSRRRP